jgi:CubicO group peptidase (beta-lactamase class C family)
MSAEKLERLANNLGGRGCVVKDGYIVQSWGNQSEKSDWMSSAKPVFSTLLFFAIEEGRVKDVHQRIVEFGWPLRPKDRPIEFYHLANMISGYKRPEGPGEAWAYNDYAIQLYQKTIFERVFKANPEKVLAATNRLGPMQFEDKISFRKDKPRVIASVRDFARLGWFWLNKGKWNDRQLLPKAYFDQYMKPHVPREHPLTTEGDGEDYLGIGTYGGGSAHFTDYGSGIYGFNWWFNGTGRLHPKALTWPDAPADTIMSIGAGGNNAVIIPSLNLVLASARGNWGRLQAGDPNSKFNEHIKLLVAAVTDRP